MIEPIDLPPPSPASTTLVPPNRGRAQRLRHSCRQDQGRVHVTRHLETDEVFLVLSGSLTIRLDDDEVTLGPGQLYVVPRGVHHQPVSVDGAEVVLIEPSTTVNTGDTPSHPTADRRLGSP